MSGELDRMRTELERLIAELYEGERKILVHGEGAPDARVMLVGEAPGEQETLQGRDGALLGYGTAGDGNGTLQKGFLTGKFHHIRTLPLLWVWSDVL